MELTGIDDKYQITTVSLTGDVLPIQEVYQGKTNRCHPYYQFPTYWPITGPLKNQQKITYMNPLLIDGVRSRYDLEDDHPALDNFKGQIAVDMMQLLMFTS